MSKRVEILNVSCSTPADLRHCKAALTQDLRFASHGEEFREELAEGNRKKARGEPESPPRAYHGVQPTYYRASRVPSVDHDLNTPQSAGSRPRPTTSGLPEPPEEETARITAEIERSFEPARVLRLENEFTHITHVDSLQGRA